MIRLSKKMKYMFDKVDKYYFNDDENGKSFEAARMVYTAFKKDEIPKNIIESDNWDLIHLDGDLSNCALDNLELVIFEDNDYETELKRNIKTLKDELKSKNEYIKKISLESNAKDGKVTNMQKQVLYEQNKIKELNKELKMQDKEIRRLLSIIADKKH